MPRPFTLLLKLLGLGLLAGQLFRLALLVIGRDQWQEATAGQVLSAFLDRGLLFDLYMNAWILLIPALLMGLRHAIGSTRRWPVVAARWVYTLLLLSHLFLACADLPFYAYTNMRLTDMALSTAQTVDQSIKELVSTPPYLIALLCFIVLAIIVVRLVGRWFRNNDDAMTAGPAWKRWGTVAIVMVLLIPGLRGTFDLGDSPLAAEDAYFCEVPFLNQLGTNGSFSFLSSLTEDHVNYLPVDEALVNVQGYLGIAGQRYTSPIARDVNFAGAPERRNVVLILVESLSANRMHRFGHPKDLMPFLESLIDSSLFLTRCYSAGTRTCNGIFSTLYGLPAIGAQHPLADPSMTSQQFHGLPQVLREAGYRTSFVYPGDPQFDNMGGFLPNNGFERFISEPDFPPEFPRNSWGVTDHALYARTIEHLRGERQPFFCTLMTISSHKGYNVPDDIAGFAPTSAESDENIYEYADRALAEFFAAARREAWYDSTVFVILGDHGQRFDPLYEVPLAYHHVPLVVHAPGLVPPRIEHGFGTQVDVAETVLGLLRLPHVNNTLGIDLTRRTHPRAFFCSDERICALDEKNYWIRSGEVEHLYDARARSTTNIASQRPAELDSLRTYAMSMVQVAQALVDQKLVGRPEKIIGGSAGSK